MNDEDHQFINCNSLVLLMQDEMILHNDLILIQTVASAGWSWLWNSRHESWRTDQRWDIAICWVPSQQGLTLHEYYRTNTRL